MRMKLKYWSRASLLSSIAMVVAGNAAAVDKIPAESGLGGFITVGASHTRFSSNMISGTDLGDIGNERIDSLTDSPDTESSTSGFFTGELNYTFADTRTQLFLGNSLEDLVRYDLAFQGGVRQEISDKGILSAAVLFSAIPTNVWADPYVIGQDRIETERESAGGRIGWAAVMGTGLEVNISHRSIEIDNEKSGEFLNLSAADAARLSREGDQFTLDVSYKYDLGQGHSFIPKIKYNNFDLDGAAMERDRIDLELAYAYLSRQYSLVSTLVYGKSDHDGVNPIYNKKEEVDSFGMTLTGFYHQPFGLKGWSAMASIAGVKADSNIDFYDADVANLVLGMLYRF